MPANTYQQPLPGWQRWENLKATWVKRAIMLKLLILLVVNIIAVVCCAIYATSAHMHWGIVNAHRDQLNYPDLDLNDLKKGFMAAIGRIVWAVLLVLGGVFAPVWLNLILAIVGLAWEIQLGEIATTNFGYLIAVGPGEIYPVTSTQCGSGKLSDSQKSFYATLGQITGQAPDSVCAGFAYEGGVLQTYVNVGLVSVFVFFILIAVIGSLSKRERNSMWETGFSYLTSAL